MAQIRVLKSLHEKYSNCKIFKVCALFLGSNLITAVLGFLDTECKDISTSLNLMENAVDLK